MKQSKNNTNHWFAEYGFTFIRISDNADMGNEIWLGANDSINNYKEKPIESLEE